MGGKEYVGELIPARLQPAEGKKRDMKYADEQTGNKSHGEKGENTQNGKHCSSTPGTFS
jgi:hypothetical protein